MKVLDPTVDTDIPFSMEIDGEVNSVDSVSVTLSSGRGFDLRFPAVYKDGVVTCSVRNISGVVSHGEQALKLEAVINGKTYTPLEETVMIAAPLKVSASIGSSLKEEVAKSSPAQPVIKASISKPAEQIAAPVKPAAVVQTVTIPAKPKPTVAKLMKSTSVNPK